jgi:thioredoxin 2
VTASILRCPACGKRNRVPDSARGVPHCGACSGSLPWVADAADHDWREVVEDAPVPVLVDFWAEWCGPCKMVSPVLEQLAVEYAGRVKLVKVDVDSSPNLSARFGIQGIPTLAVIHGGRVVARQTGAAGADHLRRWLDAALADVRRPETRSATRSPD